MGYAYVIRTLNTRIHVYVKILMLMIAVLKCCTPPLGLLHLTLTVIKYILKFSAYKVL